MSSISSALPGIAVALLLCLAIGRVAPGLGLPRVTVYLLLGVALGPSGLLRLVDPNGWPALLLLGEATAAPLAALERVSIGFILFGVGAAFRLDTLRRVGARVGAVAGMEALATGLLVGLAVFVATGSAALATIAPAFAIATAPSATLVTLREVEAEGPVSRSIVLSVGIDNLLALLAFPVLLALAFGVGSPVSEIGQALLALAVGAAAGVLAAVSLEVLHGEREQTLLGLLLVLAGLGLAHGIEAGSTQLGMLACMGAGVAVANASPHAAELSKRMDSIAYPLYVLFFLSSGRDLHLESLVALGGLGVLFVLARASGKLGGAALGVRLAGWSGEMTPWLGVGMLCQAGVALGLVAALEHAAPEQTAGLRNVVVGSVVVFELIGPWLLRQTAVRSGEVKLSSLLPHHEVSGPDALRWVGLELRRNLGIGYSDSATAGGGVTVRHAMRRRPETVREDMPFRRVLKALGESGGQHLPVVDDAGRLVGMISYDEVKNALYDPVLRNLVIARDLAEDIEDPLSPEASLSEALERMDGVQAHSWPVVAGDQLLGVVHRTDVYGLLHRGLGPRGPRGSDEAASGTGR